MEFNKETTSNDNPLGSGVSVQSQQVVPICVKIANNLKPIVHNQVHCVPMLPTYGNTQDIISTTPPGHCVFTSPVISHYDGSISEGGTMRYSGHSFSPYKQNIFARKLVVLNSPGKSPTETPIATLVNSDNLFPGTLERNDVIHHHSSACVPDPLSLSDSYTKERTKTIIPSSPTYSLSNSQTQKDMKQVSPNELAKVFSNIHSPLNSETTKKILMKCTINLKKAKQEKLKSTFKNSVAVSQKSKVKDKVNGQRLKVKKNIIQEKKTKVKSSNSCAISSECKPETESKSKGKTAQRKGSKTNLKAGTVQKADVKKSSSDSGLNLTSRWQKISNIIQILEIPGMTKYKMCEVPIFFMNGTDKRLISDNTDETCAYILCSSNDSILAIMVNFIRPDQYRMTFTGENYQVKPPKLPESKETFSLKKCIFTPYVGSVSCLSEGTHIVVFGEFTDECMMNKEGDQSGKLTSSVDLVQMVSELQSVWSGDDRLVLNPDIKPKCSNPLYKAMCRILKLKKNRRRHTPGSESKANKAKNQLKVTLKETDKPLLKQRKTSKTNIVKKSKSIHEQFYKELIHVLETREG